MRAGTWGCQGGVTDIRARGGAVDVRGAVGKVSGLAAAGGEAQSLGT